MEKLIDAKNFLAEALAEEEVLFQKLLEVRKVVSERRAILLEQQYMTVTEALKN